MKMCDLVGENMRKSTFFYFPSFLERFFSKCNSFEIIHIHSPIFLSTFLHDNNLQLHTDRMAINIMIFQAPLSGARRATKVAPPL